MKVLLVNKFLYPKGGAETYVLRMGEQLEKMGHEVQYFGMYDEKNTVGNRANAYTPNFDFHTSSWKKIFYPFQIVYSSKARKQIRKVIEDFKPDVVHMNNIHFQLTPSIIYEVKAHNIPIVYTAHDYQVICPNHMLYVPQQNRVCEDCLDGKYSCCSKNSCIHESKIKSIIGTFESKIYHRKHTYELFDKVICPSQFMEDKLQSDKEFHGKTCTIHNFIEEIEKKDVEKNDYVLYFGRFSVEKGFGTLLTVCKELPEIDFVFAGSGPLEEMLNGIDNVKNVGFKTGEELENLIREARFSIYASEWYENCPFSVMESEMYGTPVIGANMGGIPELIQDGKTGLLFERANVDDLREKVMILWNNQELLDQMTKNCQNITFDTNKEYCEKIEKIYEEVISR